MKNYMKITYLASVLLTSITASAQDQFTNCGSMMIHSGAKVTFYGNLINNKTFVDSGSGITMKGTSAQQIGGTAFAIFKNLTINNASGAYLGVSEYISGVLTITSGTFTTTGYNFTLLSNANGTASIAPILGNFAGNITMQRYLPAGATSWRFLASPVTGATIGSWQDNFATSGFHGSTNPGYPFVSIYTYNESATGKSVNGYVAATDSSNPLTPGVGFWCYIGPVPRTFDVTGPPVKFSHTFSVTYTLSAGTSDDGWVMIGNPYPSAIDWNSAAWTKTHINNAVYIWNDALQQYASWVSGVAINGGSSIIASSQSFWIQTNGASPALVSNENVKVTSNPTFLQPDGNQTFDVLRFNLVGNGYKDEALLRFGNGATNEYDASLDARKIYSSNTQVPGIASQDSTLKDLSINSMPAITSSIDVPVKTIVGTSGVYTINLDSSSVIPAGYCLVLEDKVTGLQMDISNFTSYTFSISDTTKTARFVLHIGQCGNPTGVGQLANNQYQLSAYPNPTNGLVNVSYNLNSEECNGATLQVVDMSSGKIVANKPISCKTNLEQVDLSAYDNGVYSINIISPSNTSDHVKVIKLK